MLTTLYRLLLELSTVILFHFSIDWYSRECSVIVWSGTTLIGLVALIASCSGWPVRGWVIVGGDVWELQRLLWHHYNDVIYWPTVARSVLDMEVQLARIPQRACSLLADSVWWGWVCILYLLLIVNSAGLICRLGCNN